MSQHFGDLRSPEARPGPLHTAERELGRWLAHFGRQGLLLGITERSELFPYALIMARDADGIQLEVTCHDRPAGPRPRTTWSIPHGNPDALVREPAARMFNRGMEQIRP